MTAMFVVILIEQLLSGKKNIPSVVIGITLSLASLLIFGKDGFIIPAMLIIALALGGAYKPLSHLFVTEEEGEK